MSIRVIIADDHALVRAGLRKLLENMPDVTVVAEAQHGEGAVAAVSSAQPDVLLIDISMPHGGGLPAVQQIHARWPGVRILMLSGHQEAPYVRHALTAGASGYLVKDSAPTELELAVRAVSRGETYLSPAISGVVVGDYVERLRAEAAAANPLTPRQTEVLVRIAKGQSTKEIARQLDISVKTVETHRSQLMKQLDIHEVTGLVRYAMRNGLLPADF